MMTMLKYFPNVTGVHITNAPSLGFLEFKTIVSKQYRI